MSADKGVNVVLDRNLLCELGAFYRDCVGQSTSRDLKRTVALMSNQDLGTLGVYLNFINQISDRLLTQVITSNNTEQMTLPL